MGFLSLLRAIKGIEGLPFNRPSNGSAIRHFLAHYPKRIPRCRQVGVEQAQLRGPSPLSQTDIPRIARWLASTSILVNT